MILAIIFVHIVKYNENDSLQQKLFVTLVLTVCLMLIIDILGRFDGRPETIYPLLNYIGNFLVYLLNPVLPSIWILYVHHQIFHEEKIQMRVIAPILAVNAVNIVALVLSQFYGWFYTFDSGNIYHRGSFFWFPVTLTFAIAAAAFLYLVANRRKIDKKHYLALVFFPIPIVVCAVFSIFIYGISLILNGAVLSLLIMLLNIQNSSMYTDYLTGVNNRRRLQAYIKRKIRTSTADRTFSTIMMDIDYFKAINDTFGHDIGDDALRTFAALLKNSLGSDDFIARFGGDEFYIILNASDRSSLEAAVSKINDGIQKINDSGGKPYKLRLSMGCAVYDYSRHLSVKEFQKQIDLLMYENKQANRDRKGEA